MNLFINKLLQKQRSDFAALLAKREETFTFPNDEVIVTKNVSYHPDENPFHYMDISSFFY